MATIQDVAEKAGVSVATVSRVLNGSSRVAEETRSRVQQVIDRLGYSPNLLGSQLRKMRTQTVLVVLPSISNPFYSRVVKGIGDVAKAHAYHMLLCNTDSSPELESYYIGLLRKKMADGMILMESGLSGEEMEKLSALYPMVQCSEYREGIFVPRISIDNRKAARDAVDHLAERGHRRIGLLTVNNTLISTVERNRGYADSLQQHGRPWDAEAVFTGDYTYSSGVMAAQRIARMGKPVDGVFALSDMMAIGLMKGLKQEGFRIPEDISVVGFDDISFASICEPALTTVNQPRYSLGERAMQLLLRRIRGEGTGDESITLAHSLIIRQSTR
ncbi:MAG TPA: LacI family transcriptional regulator [Clostridiales bacterium]|nr:LacI family transcriptional regulator [Clostridiales bacterium]